MRRLVHKIAMKVVLSLEDETEIETLNKLIEELLAAAPRAMILPFNLPGSSYRRMMRAADRISAFLESLATERRSETDECRDILALMTAARTDEGVGFRTSELIAEAYNALCHETSASTLVWTLLLLSQHPRVYNDLLDELDGELGKCEVGIASLNRLPLLDRVIKESLRLIPTVPFGTRFASEECALGPYELAKGTAVTFSQYVTHRLPDLYAEPLRFRPERWEDFRPSPYEYFPFGAGPHICIGAAFALLEIKIVLATVLQCYQLQVVPNARIDRTYKLSLRPRNGLPMIISKRNGRVGKNEIAGNIREMVDIS
jgi:cytochrome P450